MFSATVKLGYKEFTANTNKILRNFWSQKATLRHNTVESEFDCKLVFFRDKKHQVWWTFFNVNKDHSNNTLNAFRIKKFCQSARLGAIQIIRDIFWHFSDPPPPRVTFLYFSSLIFRQNLLWNIKWICNRVSFEALSCSLTNYAAYKITKALKTAFLKAKKVCVTFRLTPPPPPKVPRIIWMTP